MTKLEQASPLSPSTPLLDVLIGSPRSVVGTGSDSPVSVLALRSAPPFCEPAFCASFVSPCDRAASSGGEVWKERAGSDCGLTRLDLLVLLLGSAMSGPTGYAEFEFELEFVRLTLIPLPIVPGPRIQESNEPRVTPPGLARETSRRRVTLRRQLPHGMRAVCRIIML